jgi:Leucine-rich repeat (LRR) protein
MTYVRLLNFENNKISYIKKEFFSKLTNLSLLFLSYNYFGSLKKDFFQNLERLEYLNLSNNQILTIEDKTFENLGSLVYLNLSNNLIYDLSQSLFSNLSRLEILELSQNKLESIKKNIFDGLNELKYLDLTHNQIRFLYNDTFHAIINLESLYLKSNLINNLNGSLRILENLKTLDLSINKMNSFKSEYFFSNLSSLDLSYNPLKQFEYNQSNLFNFKSLKLSSISSSVIPNINFELFPELEELDLSDNLNINTSGIKTLIKLKKINLENTNISDCSFISNLKAIEDINVGDNKNYHFCLRFVRFVNLKSLKISNISLKQSFSQFENLIYLDASYNNISSLIGINYILDLIYLDLKFNMIDNIQINLDLNFNFHRLSQLEYINLNRTISKSLTNFELKFGKNLQNAILSYNNLTIFPKFCEQDDYKLNIRNFV